MRPTHGLKPSYSAPEGGWQHLPSNGISYLLSARLQALLRCTVPASALIHRPQGLDPRGGEPKGKGKEKKQLKQQKKQQKTNAKKWNSPNDKTNEGQAQAAEDEDEYNAYLDLISKYSNPVLLF